MKKLLMVLALLAVLGVIIACAPTSAPAPTVTSPTAVLVQPTAVPVQPTAVPAQPTSAPPVQATTAPQPTTASLKYDGVTITVMSQTGPTIVGPVYDHGKDFTALTGAKINVIEVPGADLFTKIQQTAAVGGSNVDLLLAPNTFMGDFASASIIDPLESYVNADKNDPDFDWSDVPAGIVSKDTWGGHIYGIMPDNNNHILFYRKDVLNDPKWQAAYKQATGQAMPVPPQTIDDLISEAQILQGERLGRRRSTCQTLQFRHKCYQR